MRQRPCRKRLLKIPKDEVDYCEDSVRVRLKLLLRRPLLICGSAAKLTVGKVELEWRLNVQLQAAVEAEVEVEATV